MERLRKGLSIFAVAALLAPAGGALAGRPVFQRHHENHEGDDDVGGKPAKGTVGDLTLRSRALLGKDGKTQLEVSTGPFDTAATPPGNISHVHVRAVDPSRPDRDGDDDDKDGKEFRFRREYNHLRGGGYFTNVPADPYTGLPHGLSLRIEAKARGAVHRDEIEARWLDSVRYRPDLYVKLIDAPAQARINTVVTINAVIGEGMGETGADTDCALLVDGTQVDSGLLWVNAGGAGTCSFMYTFPTAGQHTLTVRAQNVRPGDYDDSNNSLAKSILITQPFFAHYDASVTETTSVKNTTVDSFLISASATANQEVVTKVTFVQQLRSFVGLLPGDVNPETVRVSFSDSSGGRALSSFDLSGLTLGAPQASELPGCSSLRSIMDIDTANGRSVTVARCSDASTGTNSTSVLINYAATQTTTFSENICRTSNIGCKVGDFITTTVVPDKPLVQLADDYSAAVEVEDAATGKFTAKPAMTLAPFVLMPLNTVKLPCRPFNGTKGKQCTTVTTNIFGKSGLVSQNNAE